MNPSTWDVLIPAITAVLGALAAWLSARASYTRKLEAAIRPTEEETARRLSRRDELTNAVKAVVTDWQDNTPERVTRERCDSKHKALEDKIGRLETGLSELAKEVSEVGKQVSGLAGEVRRINGGRSSG